MLDQMRIMIYSAVNMHSVIYQLILTDDIVIASFLYSLFYLFICSFLFLSFFFAFYLIQRSARTAQNIW